jgi:hypothetical protein
MVERRVELPINRTFGDLSWYSIDKDQDTVTLSVSEARGAPAVHLWIGWVDAIRFAHDMLAVAMDGEPVTDRP